MLVNVTESLRNSIREERKKSKIRGDDLAKSIGKSPSYISQIENGIINTIDLSILYKIIKTIVPNKDINEYFNQFDVNNNLSLSDDEKKEELWKTNVELQFRKLEIPDELIKFIQEKLKSLGISGKELISEINKNSTLDNETLTKLEGKENEVFAEIDDTGAISSSIKFNLPEDLIDKIVNKEKESLNRITLEGILFNIYLLEGYSISDSFTKMSNQLKAFKILTINERNRMIREAHSKGQDISTIPAKADLESNTKMNEIKNHFVFLRDYDAVYAKKVFTSFENNLKKNTNLTFAMMKLDITKLSSLDKDNKRKFLDDIEKLVDTYYDKYIKDDIIL